MSPRTNEKTVETDVASRLDRLPFSRWHWLIVAGLGVTWILDGLEVTLVGALSGILQKPEGLGLTAAQIGATATFYLSGNVVGALLFGYLTDRLGRKKLFFVTLALYLAATAMSGLSWNYVSYCIFRFLTGAGIGGEYAAINSAIDELIPARVRGRVDLAINSTYWIGAVIGSGATYILLNQLTPRVFAPAVSWRVAFLFGALLGLGILIIRHWIPESPRWQATHGHNDDAEKTVKAVEDVVFAQTSDRPQDPVKKSRLKVRTHTPLGEIWNVVAHQHRMRSVLGLTLMVTQAFFYNAIFFTFALVLIKFYGVNGERVGLYLVPIAVGNVLGPFLLGPLFDHVGRKPMIAVTYGLAGILLAVTGYLFKIGTLSAMTQTCAWSIVFFIASCAASSAYLTVSEIFPLEIRGLAIAVFYAFGTLAGGVGAPIFFGNLIQSGSKDAMFMGYLIAAGLMISGALAEVFLGVAAERKSLEEIATPLSQAGDEGAPQPA